MLEVPERCIIPSTTVADLDRALKADSPYVFLSDVDITTIEASGQRIADAGKKSIVHAELFAGFRPDRVGLSLLRGQFGVDAVISTSTHVLETARRCGLETVYRVFLLDSRALRSAMRTLEGSKADAVEVLPGPMALSVVKAVTGGKVKRTLLAGGFIRTPELVDRLLKAGYDGITTSYESLW